MAFSFAFSIKNEIYYCQPVEGDRKEAMSKLESIALAYKGKESLGVLYEFSDDGLKKAAEYRINVENGKAVFTEIIKS
jgi:hypothetical protein